MEPKPIRCRIPDHLNAIGKERQWLIDQLAISKQQLSDYINLRNMPSIVRAVHIAKLLRLKSANDLYVWEWR